MTDNTIDEIENIQLKKDFLELFKGFDSVYWLQSFINTLPFAAAILNENRQVVFSNNVLLNKLGFKSVESLLGRKHGEILSCIHSVANKNRCGESDACKLCGAFNAIKITHETNEPVTAEFRVTTQSNKNHISQDFEVSTIPIILKNRTYMLMHLRDISHEKRRKMLEHIFFHDVINKVSGLNGFLELMNEETDLNIIQGHLQIAQSIVNSLTDEILGQRQLLAAENGELHVKTTSIHGLKFLSNICKQAQQFELAHDINIYINNTSANVQFVSDPVLLNRVLFNLIKNAVEASKPFDDIIITCSENNNKITFSVTNKAVMPPEVQLQIFQRSFSTKSSDRGLGTYSIKLLTERYLQGKVYFESNINMGTVFYVELNKEIVEED